MELFHPPDFVNDACKLFRTPVLLKNMKVCVRLLVVSLQQHQRALCSLHGPHGLHHVLVDVCYGIFACRPDCNNNIIVSFVLVYTHSLVYVKT